MELDIFKEKLNQSLNIIESVSRRSSNLSILNNVLLETEKNFLKLSATNLEYSVIWRILSKIKIEGKVLIPISLFKSVINFIKNEIIKLRSEKGNLLLKDKDQDIQIQGNNLNEFPIIPKIDNDEFIEIKNNILIEGLNQLVNIPSISQIKPEISGIYFLFKRDEIKIAATDSFRLAQKNIKLLQKINKEFSFILPQSSTKELINILSLNRDKIKIYYNQDQILFEWIGKETTYPEIQFLSRLIEGEYPNYQDIIPNRYNIQIILDKKEFQDEIKKSGLFSGKISEIKLMIISKENKLKISAQNPEIGKSEVYLPIKTQEKIDKDIEISFNYKFLLDGLNNIKSSEIMFNFNEKEDTAAITPVGDETYIYILKPIKI